MPHSTDNSAAAHAVTDAPEPIYFVHEAGLYRLRLWTAQQWAARPADSRGPAEFLPGLGWLVGEFVGMLN